MRSACLIVVAILATAAAQAAHAGERIIPVVPPEIGVAPIVGPTWNAYRCSDVPAYNFYHDAYYGEEPPAQYRDYAYRPHYRYTAYRRAPRTYFCVSD